MPNNNTFSKILFFLACFLVVIGSLVGVFFFKNQADVKAKEASTIQQEKEQLSTSLEQMRVQLIQKQNELEAAAAGLATFSGEQGIKKFEYRTFGVYSPFFMGKEFTQSEYSYLGKKYQENSLSYQLEDKSYVSVQVFVQTNDSTVQPENFLLFECVYECHGGPAAVTFAAAKAGAQKYTTHEKITTFLKSSNPSNFDLTTNTAVFSDPTSILNKPIVVQVSIIANGEELVPGPLGREKVLTAAQKSKNAQEMKKILDSISLVYQ